MIKDAHLRVTFTTPQKWPSERNDVIGGTSRLHKRNTNYEVRLHELFQ